MSKTKDPELIAAELTEKPRVSLRSYRLLEKLWPYAPEYNRPGYRSEIVADIFDGWMTQQDMAPMLDDGLVYEVRNYDSSSLPRLYISWNLTPKGEKAVFAVRRILQDQSHDR